MCVPWIPRTPKFTRFNLAKRDCVNESDHSVDANNDDKKTPNNANQSHGDVSDEVMFFICRVQTMTISQLEEEVIIN